MERQPLTPQLIQEELERTAEERNAQLARAIYDDILIRVTYDSVHRKLLRSDGKSCRIDLGICVGKEETVDHLTEIVNKYHEDALRSHLASITDPSAYEWYFRVDCHVSVNARVKRPKTPAPIPDTTPVSEPEPGQQLGPLDRFIIDTKNLLATLPRW